jgi:hypothetical protein
VRRALRRRQQEADGQEPGGSSWREAVNAVGSIDAGPVGRAVCANGGGGGAGSGGGPGNNGGAGGGILDFNEPNARINGDDGESGGTGDDGGGAGASGGTCGYGFGPDAPDLVFVRGGRKRKIRNSTDDAMISYLYRGIGYRRGLGCCGLRPSPALAMAYRWLPLRNEAWRTC